MSFLTCSHWLILCWNLFLAANREDAEAARELARSSQTKAEDAVANVSSILDSLALDQGRVNQIPTFQQEMAVNILKIKANSKSAFCH